MRLLSPFCGTVLKAQLLSLPEIIRIIAPGVVTTQLSFLPPASSSATLVAASSDRRLAIAQPALPPPTTTKSNVSAISLLPLCHLLFVLFVVRRSRHDGQDMNRSIFSNRAIFPP